MLKKFSVIILAVIQLIFCVSLVLYNPAIEWFLDKYGDVYYFKINSVTYYSDEVYGEESVIYYYNTDNHVSTNIPKDNYFVIEADENGISSFAYITDKKPKNKPYIKGPDDIHLFKKHYDFKFDENIVEAFNRVGIYNWDLEPDKKYDRNHDIIIAIKIYKGYYSVTDELYIDGIPIGNLLSSNKNSG